jgi:hypothetical protein
MMAARWADIERNLANSRRHFAMAVEAFVEVRTASSDKERYLRRAAFMHAMMAGYTSFESAMKDLTGLLEEPLPAGHDWHKALIDRLAAPVAGQRPAVLDDERLVIAIDALRGFRHVAAHGYDRFDDDRAAVAAAKAEIFIAGIGPALAGFRVAIDPD